VFDLIGHSANFKLRYSKCKQTSFPALNQEMFCNLFRRKKRKRESNVFEFCLHFKKS